jgi:hypothetical protein
MSNDPLGVTISAREIYDEIVGMREDVRSLTQTSKTVGEQLTDHEKRIRSVERWKYALPVVTLTGISTTAIALWGK